jgi:hypothetical protein
MIECQFNKREVKHMKLQQTQSISEHRYLLYFVIIVCVYMFYSAANADLQPNGIESNSGAVELNGHNVLKNQDAIMDDQTARSVSYAVLCGIYGKEKIDSELPLVVRYKDGYWVVTGTMKFDLGGVALLIMKKKSGEIVRITHGK